MADAKSFNYVATDAAGKRKKGSIGASTRERAYQLLVAQGLTVVKLDEAKNDFLHKDVSIPGFEKRAKVKSLAVFARQFALLIRAGVPMMEALKVVADQTEDKVLKGALEGVSDDVERGMSLSVAMKKRETAFPGLLSSIVAVGEEGGFLDSSLDSMAKTYKSEMELKQRIKSAMTYPVIVLFVISLIVVALLIFVVPTFITMFERMDVDLPFLTQILVTVSQNMVYILPASIVAILALVGTYRHFRNEEWLRSRVDKLRFKLPVFGPLAVKVAVARFTRNLSMMLASGVPLIASLKLVASTSNNWLLENAIADTVDQVENGRPFSTSLEKFDFFPMMVTQMIVVGERTGELSPMLETVADFYDEEVKNASESLSSALEPIIILVLGVVVGGMLLALYTPLFSLFGSMSG